MQWGGSHWDHCSLGVALCKVEVTEFIISYGEAKLSELDMTNTTYSQDEGNLHDLKLTETTTSTGEAKLPVLRDSLW